MATCTERVYRNQGNKYLVDFIPPGKKVLDCGCGAGDNARLLAEQGCSVVGITISPEEGVLAKRYCTSVIVADLEVGLPQAVSEPFDIVIASHVLEHLRRPK